MEKPACLNPKKNFYKQVLKEIKEFESKNPKLKNDVVIIEDN